MLGKGMRKRRKSGLENERGDEWTEGVSVTVQLLSRVWLCAIPRYLSLPGSSVHGIFQARILEQVAIPFSRGSSCPRDWTCISCIGRWILYHGATWEAHRGFCCETYFGSYLYWTPLIFSFLLSNNMDHLELLWGVFKMVHMRILNSINGKCWVKQPVWSTLVLSWIECPCRSLLTRLATNSVKWTEWYFILHRFYRNHIVSHYIT